MFELAERGVRCAIASDSLRDTWNPHGNGDMLDRCWLLSWRTACRTDAELVAALHMGTQPGRRPARRQRLRPCGGMRGQPGADPRREPGADRGRPSETLAGRQARPSRGKGWRLGSERHVMNVCGRRSATDPEGPRSGPHLRRVAAAAAAAGHRHAAEIRQGGRRRQLRHRARHDFRAGRQIRLRQVDCRPAHRGPGAADRRAASSSTAEAAGRLRLQMVFQDPVGSLNPRWKIGRSVGEPLDTTLSSAARQTRIAELLATVGLSPSDGAEISARVLRRTAPAYLDRPRPRRRCRIAASRRADLCT